MVRYTVSSSSELGDHQSERNSAPVHFVTAERNDNTTNYKCCYSLHRLLTHYKQQQQKQNFIVFYPHRASRKMCIDNLHLGQVLNSTGRPISLTICHKAFIIYSDIAINMPLRRDHNECHFCSSDRTGRLIMHWITIGNRGQWVSLSYET
jgi:hypothetical protein